MIIKLCGSDRFKEDFDFVQKRLEASGHEVYALSDLGIKTKLTERQSISAKKILNDVGFFKVQICDTIVVINENGYIGADTAIEIHRAKNLGKKIYYFSTNQLHEDYRQLLTPAKAECALSE